MSKILIVEDNDLNMKLFHDLLTIQNYEVLTSKTGIGIYDLVLCERPELILMDIQLGNISGIDLIKQLKSSSSTSYIPIIAITAFAMKTDEISIYKSGCDMYLPKPVSIDTFFSALEKFIPSIKKE